MAMYLGIQGNEIRLAPGYNYSFMEKQDRANIRGVTGTLNIFVNTPSMREFIIPLSWVNSSNRTIINSWWESATNLNFIENHEAIKGTTASASMNVDRSTFIALLLSNSKILAIGGESTSPGIISDCEIYNDFDANTWTAAASLNIQRAGFSAVEARSNHIVVAGGENAAGVYSTTEVYSLAGDVWTSVPSMNFSRKRFGMTLLNSGNNVLVTAGINSAGTYLGQSEIYDVSSNAWKTANSMFTIRSNFTMTLLDNDNVLVSGGETAGGTTISSCELYVTLTNTWEFTANLIAARRNHQAFKLANGNVLVVGGEDDSDRLSSCELYNPTSGLWSSAASMNVARRLFYGAIVVNSGDLTFSGEKIVVAGGIDGSAVTAVEVYDVTSDIWTIVGSLNTARFNGGTGVSPSVGRLFLPGGQDINNDIIADCEFFDLYDIAKVRIMGKEEPFQSFIKPYEFQEYTGEIVLETI